jgi:predicted neutral ceramidase superfamily lipid hydrolase
LKGNLRIIGLPCFAAAFVAATWPDLTGGTLTLGRALHIALVCVIGAIVVTLFVWYLLLRPLMRSWGIPEDSGRESDDELPGG